MLTLGSLAFASPWVLTALAVLPVIWLLLRVTPPAPKRLWFPAIRLLHLLHPKEETPARTPWWLILLRLTLAALVIFALAGPLLNPGVRIPGDGPLVLAIDDVWAAGPEWQKRQRLALSVIDQADRSGRPVVVITTSAGNDETRRSSGVVRAIEARAFVQGLTPRPWLLDHAAALAAVDRLEIGVSTHAVYLADGLDGGGDQAKLIERLQRLGSLGVAVPRADNLARILLPPEGSAADLVVTSMRAVAGGEADIRVLAFAGDGRLLSREVGRFAADGRKTEIKFTLPAEIRNQVQRLEIENESSAGAVLLLDERWRRRPVGLVGSIAFDASQPLLDELHYLDKALSPFSEVRRGPVSELLKRELAVIAVPDTSLAPPDKALLEAWINGGGVLLRFAGAKLANGEDDLVPVRLRRGDRQLGGALSWSRPAKLAPFESSGPFAGLVPPADVTVERQVLAQPSIDLSEKAWARLADGTPIVTADRRGQGWVVLVHTTANPTWSNLSISGLFVEMLRRVVHLSQGVGDAGATQALPPIETLDGFGRGEPPPATAVALRSDGRVGPNNPPGLYGNDSSKRALNLGPFVPSLAPLPPLPPGVQRLAYVDQDEIDLKPLLLAAAFLILLADLSISLWLRGLLPGMGAPALRRASAAAVFAVFVVGSASAQLLPEIRTTRIPGGKAQDDFAMQATLSVRLGYVVTGDPATDDLSKAGLFGLSQVLVKRTAVEVDVPMGVDVESDELAFFALIYWPMHPGQSALTPQGIQRLNTYLKNGGTILFDTRDQGEVIADPFNGGPGTQKLREIVRGLAVPPLAPVPPEHVLTKAFYLLKDFPGRYTGGEVWVENRRQRGEDEVSSIIVGGNDWAGAWANDARGRPLRAVVPGGEVQREFAYRFGVNLVMYALTGNYKADQVHVPAILERLGQ